MIELDKIYNENCLDYLNRLDDRSVDLFVLDPPYMNVVNDEWDKQWDSLADYISWCESWIVKLSTKAKYSCSLWLFGFPYQLMHLIPVLERHNFKFRQQIVIWKGMQSAAGRTSDKLKMFPTTSESAMFFAYNSIPVIKELLHSKKMESGRSAKELNEILGKASNGGGTWSQIAGPKQQTMVQPIREDWQKLDALFGGLPSYDDYVFKFNLPMGLCDVWNDLKFYERLENKFHPTQKPIPLIERIVKSSSNVHDLVIDLFMGSATTAIACRNTKRHFSGCEIDQSYYTQSLERLATYQAPEEPIWSLSA